jgi:hypothetical protein
MGVYLVGYDLSTAVRLITLILSKPSKTSVLTGGIVWIQRGWSFTADLRSQSATR